MRPSDLVVPAPAEDGTLTGIEILGVGKLLPGARG
jgi:hypothetical protein